MMAMFHVCRNNLFSLHWHSCCATLFLINKYLDISMKYTSCTGCISVYILKTRLTHGVFMAGFWDGHFQTVACLWGGVSRASGWVAGIIVCLWGQWACGEAGKGQQPTEKAKHGPPRKTAGKEIKDLTKKKSHTKNAWTPSAYTELHRNNRDVTWIEPLLTMGHSVSDLQVLWGYKCTYQLRYHLREEMYNHKSVNWQLKVESG